MFINEHKALGIRVFLFHRFPVASYTKNQQTYNCNQDNTHYHILDSLIKENSVTEGIVSLNEKRRKAASQIPPSVSSVTLKLSKIADGLFSAISPTDPT